jgi:hypothetical protein
LEQQKKSPWLIRTDEFYRKLGNAYSRLEANENYRSSKASSELGETIAFLKNAFSVDADKNYRLLGNSLAEYNRFDKGHTYIFLSEVERVRGVLAKVDSAHLKLSDEEKAFLLDMRRRIELLSEERQRSYTPVFSGDLLDDGQPVPTKCK